MTLSKIEKCARLMGYEPLGINIYGAFEVDKSKSKKELHAASTFNPLTNKADLVDLMCAVGIDFQWHDYAVLAVCTIKGVCEWGYFKDHPDKQTALAHAVVEVAVQIYDRKFGGE